MTREEFITNPTIRGILDRLSKKLEELGNLPSKQTSYEYGMFFEIKESLVTWGEVELDEERIDRLSKLSPEAIVDAIGLWIFEDDADRFLCSQFSSRECLNDMVDWVLDDVVANN